MNVERKVLEANLREIEEQFVHREALDADANKKRLRLQMEKAHAVAVSVSS